MRVFISNRRTRQSSLFSELSSTQYALLNFCTYSNIFTESSMLHDNNKIPFASNRYGRAIEVNLSYNIGDVLQIPVFTYANVASMFKFYTVVNEKLSRVLYPIVANDSIDETTVRAKTMLNILKTSWGNNYQCGLYNYNNEYLVTNGLIATLNYIPLCICYIDCVVDKSNIVFNSYNRETTLENPIISLKPIKYVIKVNTRILERNDIVSKFLKNKLLEETYAINNILNKHVFTNENPLHNQYKHSSTFGHPEYTIINYDLRFNPTIVFENLDNVIQAPVEPKIDFNDNINSFIGSRVDIDKEPPPIFS